MPRDNTVIWSRHDHHHIHLLNPRLVQRISNGNPARAVFWTEAFRIRWMGVPTPYNPSTPGWVGGFWTVFRSPQNPQPLAFSPAEFDATWEDRP